MTPRRWLILIAASAVVLTGVLSVASGGSRSVSGLLNGAAVKNEGADTSSINVAISGTEDGVDWSLITYDSEKGPCLKLSLSGVDQGSFGGCGAPDGPFSWFSGRGLVGDRYIGAVFGTAGDTGAVQFKVILSDGSAQSAEVRDGLWVVLSHSTTPPPTPTAIEAVDGNGDVVAKV